MLWSPQYLVLFLCYRLLLLLKQHLPCSLRRGTLSPDQPARHQHRGVLGILPSGLLPQWNQLHSLCCQLPCLHRCQHLHCLQWSFLVVFVEEVHRSLDSALHPCSPAHLRISLEVGLPIKKCRKLVAKNDPRGRKGSLLLRKSHCSWNYPTLAIQFPYWGDRPPR